MPLVGKRVPPETVAVLDDLLVNEVAKHRHERVLSASDINSMLGFERMREAVNCDDLSCAAEIGGALGVEFLLAGSIGQLGDEVIVALKLIHIAKAQVEGRAQITGAHDERLYRHLIESAVAQLFGHAPPAPAAPPVAQPPRVVAQQPSVPVAPLEHDLRRLVPADRNRYLKYRQTTPTPLDVRDWAYEQNQESTPLFVAELGALGLLAVGSLGLSMADPDERAVGSSILFTTGLIALPIMLLFDAFDLGTVEFMP